MSSSNLPTITVGSQEYAERLANVIGAAFANDPLNRAGILYTDSLPNDSEISVERRAKSFLPNITSKAANGALLVEAGDWAAVALWVPPGVKIPSPDRNLLSPTMNEYFERFSQAKKKHLRDRQYWFLNLLARHPDRNEPGVIRALFEPYIQQAQEADIPAWVEAINEHARDVYTHFGFRVVEEVIIGEGTIDRIGNRVSGGEGIVVYGMIREP